MKIYFAGSIRGGRDDQTIYKEIIELLGTFGTVLTEHFGKADITSLAGTGSKVEQIYQQDMNWIQEADVIVAEVTTPSLGVGYEIAKAETMGKHILCLYRPHNERSLSAMIAGSPYNKKTVREYSTTQDVESIFKDFFGTLQ